MFYIGLDVSTKCGIVALSDSGDVMRQEVVVSKLAGIPRAMDVAFRVGELLAEIDEIIPWPESEMFRNKFRDMRVAIEGYGFATQQLAKLVEVGTLVRARLVQLQVPYIEVPPTQLKKFVTGKGNAKKEDMMLAAYKRWGVEGTNDEIDALGLAQFARAIDGRDCGLPKVNLDAVTAWKSKHKVPWHTSAIVEDMPRKTMDMI